MSMGSIELCLLGSHGDTMSNSLVGPVGALHSSDFVSLHGKSPPGVNPQKLGQKHRILGPFL